MKKAEIISVGTELLMGQVANTDAQYISSVLPEAGFGVYYHTVVGDNRDRLLECLKQSSSRSDLIVLTGGLGPTEDDLTKKTVASFLGLKLVKDEKTAKDIEDYFKESGRRMTPSNLSQSYFPEGSLILANDFGTAPGCIIKSNAFSGVKTYVLLPGPPQELFPMFKNKAVPLLYEEGSEVLLSSYISIIGVSESEVESLLLDIISGKTNPTCATYVKDGTVTVRISASGTPETAEELLKKDREIIRERLGNSIVSENGQSIAEIFVRLCEKENITFSCAESCTGGMIAEMITSVPGASNVIKSSLVTYSSSSKTDLLGVPEEIIDRFGVVSKETAEHMAGRCLSVCGTDIAVSTTGNAGPGVLENKPAGLVYISVCFRGKTATEKFIFKGGRDYVRRRASNAALNMARKMIIG